MSMFLSKSTTNFPSGCTYSERQREGGRDRGRDRGKEEETLFKVDTVDSHSFQYRGIKERKETPEPLLLINALSTQLKCTFTSTFFLSMGLITSPTCEPCS